MLGFGKKTSCPYCNQQLEKEPTRKTKCPHCRQLIIVRKGELMTEDDSQLMYWILFLDKYGITKQQIESTRNELSIKLSRKASARETIRYLLNSWVIANPNLRHTQFIYREMARLVGMEGKDTKPYIEEALRSQLMLYKMRGVKNVRVHVYGWNAADDAHCPQCRKMHGIKLSIDEALEKMPAPRNCTSDECSCEYEPEGVNE